MTLADAKTMLRWTHTLPLFCAVAAGCVGDIGDGQETGPDGPLDPQAFTCTPGDPSPTVLPRLSRAQYIASLSDLAERATGDGEAVIASLTTPFVGLPNDGDPDHDRLDQTVSQAHIDGQYYVALAFATELTRDSATVEALAGACAVDGDTGNDAACLEDFIRGFGLHAHRRPLTDDEVAFYRDEVFAPAAGMDPLALRDVLTVMVLSPWFLYRVENEGEALAGSEGLFRLSGYELATRLALHFWDSPPDDQLLAAAESGALDSEEGYAAEVDRLLADPRTQRTMDRFFSEWFALDDLAPLDQGLNNPAYAAFVGDDVPTAELRANMIEDSLDLLRFTTWQDEGSLADVFLTDRSFAKTDDMRALYGGVAAWDGESTPARMESGGRAGILTRPALLATGSITTHPTLRGRDIRKRVLCGEMPPKPDDVDLGDLPVIDPALGERARMEELTGDGTCAGCHSLMDPLGFNLAHFDGLGRYREVETVFADDGSVIAEVTLDTTSTPNFADGEEVTDAVELSRAVVESGEPQACFARHYFRFAFGRAEDFEADGCLLEDMRTRLDEGEPLRDVMRDIALSTAFRTKKLAD